MQIKITKWYHLTSVDIILSDTRNNKCWWGPREKEMRVHYGGNVNYYSLNPSTDKWIKKMWHIYTIVSVQFSPSVVSVSWQPHELQHARPPCPSWTPGVHSNSHPSSQWCHPANPSSVVPFSSCPQSLTASGSFPMSQLFAWGGQSIDRKSVV